MVDVTVEHHGSIVLLKPQTDVGRAWLEDNIGPDNGYQPYWPGSVVVEPRYVVDIIYGLQNDGLEVEA